MVPPLFAKFSKTLAKLLNVSAETPPKSSCPAIKNTSLFFNACANVIESSV